MEGSRCRSRTPSCLDDRQLLATAKPPPPQYSTSAARRHTRSKAVLPLTRNFLRLVGSFWHETIWATPSKAVYGLSDYSVNASFAVKRAADARCGPPAGTRIRFPSGYLVTGAGTADLPSTAMAA